MLRFIIFSILFIISFSSCVNDLETITKITYDPNSPDNVTQDLELFYADSGYAKIQVFATLAETYSKPESIMKLKDGVKINFFSENGKISSTLTALYGEVNYSTGLIFVKDSVKLRNLNNNQVLETEELNWNQKDSLIFTNRDVIIHNEEGVLYGKGIKTNQNFDHYEFLNPEGKINLSNSTNNKK
jgi:LPS export ABC transporter protein LptC